MDGVERGATLSLEEDRLRLRVTIPEGPIQMNPLDRLELLHFRGSRNGFTLLDLMQINSQMRLGVGGITTYSVSLAIEDVLFEARTDIVGRDWLLYVEDLPKIIHVTGLQHTIQIDEDGSVRLMWFFEPAVPVELPCPNAGYTFYIGQDFRTTGDPITGPGMTFRYSARLHTPDPIELHEALRVLNRVRLFFSLVMGRVLQIDEVVLRIVDGESTHTAHVHGIIPTTKSDKPSEPLLRIEGAVHLASLLDQWLVQFPRLADAIHLHMDGLEQRKLPAQLRFQAFIQALEALHRRVSAADATPIDVAAVSAELRNQNIPNEIVDRVGGVLAHAHEPGLRQRLRHYWDDFAEELAVLRPGLPRRTFVGRVVATRNHFAHRTDRDDQVLDGRALWDATETVKAISHMALIQQIGGQVSGLGQAMLNRRFAEYVIEG